MKLSIITVNLNNSSGLQKTIESVICQTSRDFEHIIIDGGSTDGSIDVIKSYTNIPQGIYTPRQECHPNPQIHPITQSKFKQEQLIKTQLQTQSQAESQLFPITYWISEPDHGLYHAMNKGILIAKGDYCEFLNSGDWLVSPDVIEKMFTNFPDCSIYYGNMLKQNSQGKLYRDTCSQGNITMLTFYRGTLNHSPAFIKRSLFEKYGLYDEILRITSDWKWYLNVIVFHNEPVQYVNLDITFFDMKGISNTNQELNIQERRKVLEQHIPSKILKDYDYHWRNIDQVTRIKRYKITSWFFWLIERVLFKIEKLREKCYFKSPP